MEVLLRLRVPRSFSLSRAVCSYGFYMTHPNAWNVSKGVLERPLRLEDGRAVMTCVWEEQEGELLTVRVKGLSQLEEHDERVILDQVKRMLRLSDEENSVVDSFHALHPKAKAEGFGRLFRSPTLFEDMVKSILLCNCNFARTLQMSKYLCELQSELKGPPLGYIGSNTGMTSSEVHLLKQNSGCKTSKTKRKTVISRSTCKSRIKKLQKTFSDSMESAASFLKGEESKTENDLEAGDREDEFSETSKSGTEIIIGAFPTAEELADLDPVYLGKRCVLGYRAQWIHKLAKDVSLGNLQLNKFEGPEALQGDMLRAAVMQVAGFGPYSGANVMMLLGNYNVIPTDTETIRHLKQFHGKQPENLTKRELSQLVAAIYEKNKPFEFLAYWWEMWRSYELCFGDLSRLSSSCFHLLTGPRMKSLKTTYSFAD